MRCVRIRRGKEFVNAARGYRVLVDGEPQGKLMLGQDIELMLDGGEHDVEAQIDWCRSRPFRIPAGREEVWLVVKSASVLGAWRVFFSPSSYLAIEAESVPSMEDK